MAPKAPAKPDPAAKADAADGAHEEAPEKKRSKLPILIVAVVLLAGLGAGGWFLAPRFLGGAKAAPEEALVEEPIHAVVPLGSIVVNVNNPDARRYVKVGVELGVPTAVAAKEVEKHKPQLLDLLV